MFELGKVVGWLASPLALALLSWGLTLGLFVGRGRRWALGVGLAGMLGLWGVSMPYTAHVLARQLEGRYPAVPVEQAPEADAILVLGGALAGASPPLRPGFDLGPAADRVWHGAALYRAGKARWVVVSGGNQPGMAALQVEAEAIRAMLLTLGVPDSTIRLEGVSRNTTENARESAVLLREVGARRVLLVTSALHMPRALATFRGVLSDAGVTLLPASTDVEGLPDTLHPLGRWLPDANALALSSRALKEYVALAGMSVGLIY